MLKNMLSWMLCDLAEFKVGQAELFNNCLEEDLGRFVYHFGQEFMDSLLDLSDEELVEIYPETNCPCSYNERQLLKAKLYTHILICSACKDTELRNMAATLMIEKAISRFSPIRQMALTV